MPSSEIVEMAKKAARENPEAFEALLEFERTGKLRKLKYKERVNFTIDTEIMRKFRSYCKRKGFKMSTLLENLIMKNIGEKI